jgi:hypothetical protein
MFTRNGRSSKHTALVQRGEGLCIERERPERRKEVGKTGSFDKSRPLEKVRKNGERVPSPVDTFKFVFKLIKAESLYRGIIV